MKIDPTITLNPPQQFVVDAKMLETGFSCVLQMPTGTGKTWLSLLAVQNVLARGRRAIYLTPLRALADELYPQWTSKFSPSKVGIFTGDYGKSDRKYPVPFAEANVLIMTPERLDACTRAWRSHWQWIPEVDLIVVDEAHLIGDPHRGGRLEGAISRFRRLNPFCRFLCLSATLGNREELADWLNGIEYASHWRPIPLTWRIARYRKADDKPGLLAREVAATKASGGRSLVFAQSRRRCETLANFLKDQGLRAGFHHAGLAFSNRRKIEGEFRSEVLDALVATGTLEMGLNMPVQQVVLFDTQFFDGIDFSPLPVNTVWQRAGRAGRPGLDTKGEAVLFSPAWDRSVDCYPSGKFERISSTLAQPTCLAEQIVAEVGSGLCRSEVQIERAFGQSLAGFQKQKLPVSKVIQQMLSAAMLRTIEPKDTPQNKSPRLAITPLGRVACRHLIQPATVIKMKELFDQFPDFSHFDVLLALALSPDCEPILPVDFEELSILGMQLNGIPSHICAQPNALKSGEPSLSGKRILSGLKTAALLYGWCRHFEGDADLAAEEFSVYPFEVLRLQESFLRLLTAVAAVSKHIFSQCDAFQKEETFLAKPYATRRIELLRNMVACGLPESSAILASISGIGPKWLQTLNSHGISNLNDLSRADFRRLKIKGLSLPRARKWRKAALKLIENPLPSVEHIAPTIDCAIFTTSRQPYDPYRMRRARDLTVRKVSAEKGYAVQGGLEPHRVTRKEKQWQCDCADFAKGNLCKHIIAVNMHLHQTGSNNLQQDKSLSDNTIDLFELWFQS
jgi:helicase